MNMYETYETRKLSHDVYTKIQWKKILLLIKREYYPQENIKNVSKLLREKLNVTQEMIFHDKAYFSETDFIFACVNLDFYLYK